MRKNCLGQGDIKEPNRHSKRPLNVLWTNSETCQTKISVWHSMNLAIIVESSMANKKLWMSFYHWVTKQVQIDSHQLSLGPE